MEFLSLIWSFFKIGVMSFGGGWTIVGLIKAETVPHWIDEADFASLVAIAQATPGPVALNAATLVGWKSFGAAGAAAATTAVLLFPVLSIVVAGLIGSRVKLDKKALGESLKTGTLAMMLMTLWFLLPKAAPLDPILVGLGVASFALAAFTKLNPLWAIFGAAAINMVLRLIWP
jgi:chromate transporter